MEIIKVRKKNHAFLHVDASPSVMNELTDFFTFYVPNYKFHPKYKEKLWDGKIRLYNSRDKQLYVGLYRYVLEFANTEGRNYTVELEHDSYYGFPNTNHEPNLDFISGLSVQSNGKPISVRDYQMEAVAHGIKHRQAMLISPTGSGKSLIIYLLIRHILETTNKRILVVVPTTSLVQQMVSDFKDYSSDDDTFNTDELCHMIYSGKEKININQKIIVSTWQSIFKLPASWFEQFGAVFGDEAHNFKAKSLISIMTKLREAEYRFGTTGTLDGATTNKLVLEGLFGPVYHVTTTKKLMDSGTLADLKINILLTKYPTEVCIQTKKSKYADEIDFIVRYEPRNKFIRNLALDLDGNTLILFQFVEKHGKVLYDLIKEQAHERRKVFFVSGSTDVEVREQIRSIVDKTELREIQLEFGDYKVSVLAFQHVPLSNGTYKTAIDINENDDVLDEWIIQNSCKNQKL